MQKVLIVNHTSRLGGAENVLLTFLRSVTSTDVEFSLAAPEGPLLEHARRLGVRCFLIASGEMTSTRRRLSITDLFSTVRTIRAVHAIVAAMKLDLIMSNSVKAHIIGWIVSRQTNVPQLIRLHDQMGSFSNTAKSLIRMPLKQARMVSCVSESVACEVRSILASGANVHVCYNGVDMEDNGDIVHTVGRQVVVAGWIFPWKGFDVFIRAMEMVADSLKGWQFVLAGDAACDVVESQTYMADLRDMVSRSRFKGQFAFHGAYHSLREVICCPEHSIFVLPSQRPDPLPTVLLEAGMLGVPVVATDAGGAKEIITAGISGVLSRPDAHSIGRAVLELASSLETRNQLGEALKTSICSTFSISTYANGLSRQISACVQSRETHER